MTTDARAALQALIASLERHLDAVSSKRSPEDPAVEQAYLQIEDAFLGYEEALAQNYDEYLPIELTEEE
jgi:hypothetical protein